GHPLVLQRDGARGGAAPPLRPAAGGAARPGGGPGPRSTERTRRRPHPQTGVDRRRPGRQGYADPRRRRVRVRAVDGGRAVNTDGPPAAPPSAEEAAARAGLSAVAEPGDPVLGALLRTRPAAQVWAALRAGAPLDAPEECAAALHGRLERWRGRARGTDVDRMLARAAEHGARLVLPGDPEWPSQLDTLAERRPHALWVRGAHDLRNACRRAVSVVGSRAASAYGLHVTSEMAHTLAERGWCVVSGGAYGIDGAAHRGALAGGAATVAVLACGVDVSYPRGHEQLFAEITGHGVLVSEHPPGTTPSRHAFLVRNRLIAALTPGTVVVEAGQRSG